ncbi:glycoside hydrolase family 24 protein [Aquimarina algicola]|nr:glycoside hydrolase family 104 protein [Aquimarina algicola]
MFPKSKADSNPEAMIRAFMRLVKEFEGVPGEEGYTTLFGGSQFTDTTTHPEKPIYWYTKKDGTKMYSSAAGAYQIMQYVWWDYNGWVVKDYKKTEKRNENRNFVKKYGIKDFSPKSQDEFCIALLIHAKPGLLDKLLNGFVTQAIEEHAAHIWASLTPGRFENQGPAKHAKDKKERQELIHEARIKQLKSYNKFLAEELDGQSDLHLEPGFLKRFGIKEPEPQELIENKKEGLDLNKVLEGLNKRAGAMDIAVGYCAKYVRWALEDGGMKTWGPNEIEQRPNYACNYGPFLLHKGFVEVSNEDYKKGDIVVIESFSGHKAGHIQIYNGENWVSDFIQNYFYPGRAYRKAKPNYKTYRWE